MKIYTNVSSQIHFELTLYKCEEIRYNLILACGYIVLPARFVEQPTHAAPRPPLNCLVILVEISIDHKCMGFIFGLSILFHLPICLSCQYHSLVCLYACFWTEEAVFNWMARGFFVIQS